MCAQTLLTQNPLPEGSIDSHHNSSHRPNLCDRRLAFGGCSELIPSHHLYWLIDSNIAFNTIFIKEEVLTHNGLLMKGWSSFTELYKVNRKTLFFAALVKDLRELRGWRQHKNWEYFRLNHLLRLFSFPVSHKHVWILLIYSVFCLVFGGVCMALPAFCLHLVQF